jgi:hypothetical protein
MASAAPSTVADALAGVERWKAEEEKRHTTELSEIESEMGSLRSAMANLQQQLDALEKVRGDLGRQSGSLRDRHVEQAHLALLDALTRQSKAFAEREKMALDIERSRRADLEKSLPKTAVGPQLEEYVQFKTVVEPTLAALPDSYRQVVLSHHTRVVDQLREHVSAQLAAPVPIDAAPIALDAVYAIDAPDGKPELLVLMLPVSDRIVSDWQAMPDGLQMWLGTRAVQAIAEAARESSADCEPLSGGHQGLLAIEVDLTDGGAPYAMALERRLADRLRTGAPELSAANVAVTLRKVDVDFLMPPESDEVSDDR